MFDEACSLTLCLSASFSVHVILSLLLCVFQSIFVCLSVLIALSVTPSALFAVSIYIYNLLSLSLSLCPCLFLALHLTRLLCCDKWKVKSLKGNNRRILLFAGCLWLSALIWKPFLFRYLNVRGLEDDIWK